MAKEHPAALADRLFSSFLAPLILGGPMTLGRPIGCARAFSMSAGLRPVDQDAWSRVGVARVRVARRFAPLDTLTELGADQWALGAGLHDLVQATHPQLAERFGGRRAKLLLQLCEKTFQHVPSCGTALDALTRHTLFSRLFEVARTLTTVSWWTGSARFDGVEPPARLLAWREFRRVQVRKDPVRLEGLMGQHHLAHLAEDPLRAFLSQSPLTDWCTMLRPWPTFSFTAHNLGLAMTVAGRKLVLRALRGLPQKPLDACIGQSLEPLLVPAHHAALRAVLDVFGEHVLEESLHTIFDPKQSDAPLRLSHEPPIALAQAAGALAAREYLGLHGDAFTDIERRALLHRLLPHTQGEAADRLRAIWPQASAA